VFSEYPDHENTPEHRSFCRKSACSGSGTKRSGWAEKEGKEGEKRGEKRGKKEEKRERMEIERK
jgi:hypothetical protein